MASTNTTRRKSAPQPKNNQTHEQWHEERYGEHRDRLSDEQLKQLVEDICGKNYDETAAAALCLLMDEFERAQFNGSDVQNLAVTVNKGAFKYTVASATAADAMVSSMRRKFAETEVVN